MQATGKSVDAVKKLILGPTGSRIEMVMAQGLGGGTRTVRMARRADTPVSEPAGAGGGGTPGSPASERRLRQQIVPAAGAVPAAWSTTSSSLGALHRTPGSTQVGLSVAHELDPSIDKIVFGGSGCVLRVTDVLHNCSVGRYERVEIGTSPLCIHLCVITHAQICGQELLGGMLSH